MGVWSTGDFALTEAQMTGSAAYVAGPWRYERVAGPGHWMQLEAPDTVNRCSSTFWRPDPGRPVAGARRSRAFRRVYCGQCGGRKKPVREDGGRHSTMVTPCSRTSTLPPSPCST